jgi:hypothetical protein
VARPKKQFRENLADAGALIPDGDDHLEPRALRDPLNQTTNGRLIIDNQHPIADNEITPRVCPC